MYKSLLLLLLIFIMKRSTGIHRCVTTEKPMEIADAMISWSYGGSRDGNARCPCVSHLPTRSFWNRALDSRTFYHSDPRTTAPTTFQVPTARADNILVDMFFFLRSAAPRTAPGGQCLRRFLARGLQPRLRRRLLWNRKTVGRVPRTL